MPVSGAVSSAGERFVHTEEVTGSIPVPPTTKTAGQGPLFAACFDGLLNADELEGLAFERVTEQGYAPQAISYVVEDVIGDDTFTVVWVMVENPRARMDDLPNPSLVMPSQGRRRYTGQGGTR